MMMRIASRSHCFAVPFVPYPVCFTRFTKGSVVCGRPTDTGKKKRRRRVYSKHKKGRRWTLNATSIRRRRRIFTGNSAMTDVRHATAPLHALMPVSFL